MKEVDSPVIKLVDGIGKIIGLDIMVIVCHHGCISGCWGRLANVEEQKIEQVMFRSIKGLDRSSLRPQRVHR